MIQDGFMPGGGARDKKLGHLFKLLLCSIKVFQMLISWYSLVHALQPVLT